MSNNLNLLGSASASNRENEIFKVKLKVYVQLT